MTSEQTSNLSLKDFFILYLRKEGFSDCDLKLIEIKLPSPNILLSPQKWKMTNYSQKKCITSFQHDLLFHYAMLEMSFRLLSGYFLTEHEFLVAKTAFSYANRFKNDKLCKLLLT